MWLISCVFGYKVRGGRFESHGTLLDCKNCECSEQRVRWIEAISEGRLYHSKYLHNKLT